MSVKVERIEQIIQKEVSQILQQEVKEPGLSWVVITDVTCSRDLSFAKIFVSTRPEETKQVMESLDKAKGFIRSLLSSRLSIRKVPQLLFELDDSIDRGNRIEEILKKV